MKKKIIAVVFAVVLLLLSLKIYDTYARYTLPEEVYYGVGESFLYNGLKYELKGIEVRDMEELAKEYDVDRENLVIGDEKYEYKFFLATINLTAMDEQKHYDTTEIGLYSKYFSDYAWAYPPMYYLNDECLTSISLEKGETMEYHVLYRLSTNEYTKESLEKLGADDIAVIIFDFENGCVNYMCNNGTVE